MKNTDETKKDLIKKVKYNNPGSHQNFYNELTAPEFVENLKLKDYPITLKNWLYSVNFALTTLKYGAVENICLDISNSIVFGADGDYPQFTIEGGIMFNNRSSIMPLDNHYRAPSNAGVEFRKSYRGSCTYKEKFEDLKKNLQVLPINKENNNDYFNNLVKINFSRRSLERDILQCFDSNYHQFAEFLKYSINERINTIDNSTNREDKDNTTVTDFTSYKI